RGKYPSEPGRTETSVQPFPTNKHGGSVRCGLRPGGTPRLTAGLVGRRRGKLRPPRPHRGRNRPRGGLGSGPGAGASPLPCRLLGRGLETDKWHVGKQVLVPLDRTADCPTGYDPLSRNRPEAGRCPAPVGLGLPRLPRAGGTLSQPSSVLCSRA